MHKMRFVLFDQFWRGDSRALTPNEIHLRVNGAERQPRFED
jgi:hypothetical protein